jgi:branched-chain amino acid transport system substrate-binding protein
MLRFIVLISLITLFVGCAREKPVTIGFIGGLTGRTADLGSHSRNGMILAIEEWNERGGINGKPIEMLIHDDKQDPARARAVLAQLIEADVNAIVGPSTSSMAVEVAPLANEAGIVVIGTTVTTNQLKDKDDTFFRTVATTQNSTIHLVEFLKDQYPVKQFAVVQDLSNKAYTESWKTDFINGMAEDGIKANFEAQFTSGDNLKLLEISQQLVLLETDLIVLVTNATDAALLVKQIRSINTKVNIVTAEWAGTSQFIQLAGRDAEGVVVPRYIDESSEDPRFIDLTTRYEERFQQDMGYPGLLAYNATNAVLEAIKNKSNDISIKEYLINKGEFPAVLATFELNQFGDEVRNAFHFVTQVEDGKYITVRD